MTQKCKKEMNFFSKRKFDFFSGIKSEQKSFADKLYCLDKLKEKLKEKRQKEGKQRETKIKNESTHPFSPVTTREVSSHRER